MTYTVRDLVWYTGFICGAAITSLSLQPFELNRLSVLIASVGVGFVLAYLLETAYNRSKQRRYDAPPPPREEEDFNSYKRDDRM